MQNTPTGAAHAAPQRNQRIVALDGLRALAIAGVVLYHLRPSRLTGGSPLGEGASGSLVEGAGRTVRF